MKNLIIFLSFIFFSPNVALSCCAENSYQLIPVGQIDEEVIFIEIEFYRNCNHAAGPGPGNEFWIQGTTNIVSSGMKDSITLIKAIDTFRITECECTYRDYYEKTNFESAIKTSYQKALDYARQLKNFKSSTPVSISFNNSINTELIINESDSTNIHIVEYNDSLKMDLTGVEILSCAPHNAAIVRTYETKGFQITIVRLRCQSIKERSIKNITARFKDIENSVWKEMAQWHGQEKDYYFIHKRQ